MKRAWFFRCMDQRRTSAVVVAVGDRACVTETCFHELRTVATCETGGKRLELNDVTGDLRHRDVVNEVLKGDAASVS